MGGMKRKIEIKKRESRSQRAVTCSKRRKCVFKKAAEVSVVCGAKIAVYASSPSENSDAVYSFSSDSAYEIARCFLNNEIPCKSKPNSKSSFWWENPDLEQCEDSYHLHNLMDRLRKAKYDAIAAFVKKKPNQFVPNLQNPNFSLHAPLIEATTAEMVSGDGFSGGEGWLINGVEENEKAIAITENFAMRSTPGAFSTFQDEDEFYIEIEKYL